MYRELLGAFALNAVNRDEEVAVGAHLEECESCRDEVARHLAMVAALPLGVGEMEPPPRLRDSILSAIDQELSARPLRISETQMVPPTAQPPIDFAAERSARRWFPWAAAAAMLLLSIGLLGWNFSLRDSDETAVRTFELAATSPDVAASGEATYLEDEGIISIQLANLPDLAANEVYQVWLIDDSGPVSAGVLRPGESEFAVVANPDDYTVLAITAEAGPIGAPAPSNAPFLQTELQTG